MARQKRIRAPPPRPRLPRNTVTLWLDGTALEIVESFRQCQAHFYYWILCNSKFRVRHGNQLLFTTPLDGTFYYVVRYNGRYVVFVIMARAAWLIGFCTAKGFFEVQSPEIDGFYMDSAHTKQLHFNGNHKAISSDGTGNTSVNLHAARYLFDELCDYDGPSRHMDAQEVASALGFYVILIMESKCKEIFLRHCSAIVGPVDVRLGNDWVKRAINNWSTGSQQALRSVDDITYEPHDCGLVHLQCLDDILRMFFYLHVDAFNYGMFYHEPMGPEPRKLTWEHVDKGSGDGDIFVLEEPHPRKIGHIACRGARKRPCANLADSSGMVRKKRKGLSGGGLGGPPEAPSVFMEWAESHKDRQTCDNLTSHLATMGLEVLQSKREPIYWPLKRLADPEAMEKLADLEEGDKCASTPKDEPDANTPTSDHLMSKPMSKRNNTGLCSADLDSLGAHQFVTDGIIDFAFKTLSRKLRQNDVHNVLLVKPAVSFFICNGPRPAASQTVELLKLSTRRLVLFPVNNSANLEQADRGSHWSLLVLDQWTKDYPRLLHYDSARGTNVDKAHHLAAVLQPYLSANTGFSECPTPQQDNGYDCALYLINIARVICRWCEVHACTIASTGKEEDWSIDIGTEVNPESAMTLRSMFQKNLAKHISEKTP